ncbi:MAG: hypothetical protein ACI84C_002078 [Flavobacteriales bacterium]|jgi:hypothetical protein
MSEIINKIENSGLITIDLEAYKPKGTIVVIDIKNQLWQGMILKEEPFRAWVKETDWSQYRDQLVGVFCSEDAIVPIWAFMLIASKLEGIAENVTLGSEKLILEKHFRTAISSLDVQPFTDSKIMIKGCGKNVPDSAYLDFLALVQPVAASIMYGEPCGAVPVWKKPRAKRSL